MAAAASTYAGNSHLEYHDGPADPATSDVPINRYRQSVFLGESVSDRSKMPVNTDPIPSLLIPI